MTLPSGQDSGPVQSHEPHRTEIADASVGELLGKVSQDLTQLMRQELELAKAELKQEAKTAGAGAGMLGGAGFAGYLFILFLSAAAWWGLANSMDTGLAALIVALVWGVIAAVLAFVGRARLRQVQPVPERTVETLQQVPGAVTGHRHNTHS